MCFLYRKKRHSDPQKSIIGIARNQLESLIQENDISVRQFIIDSLISLDTLKQLKY